MERDEVVEYKERIDSDDDEYDEVSIPVLQLPRLQNFEIFYTNSRNKNESINTQLLYSSSDMRFPQMWHFDKCRLRRACPAPF